MTTKSNLTSTLSVIVAVTAVVLYYSRHNLEDLVFKMTALPLPSEMTSHQAQTLPKSSIKPTQSTMPSSSLFEGINLAVPFSAQAPLGDWSLPYEEACEETSSILVDLYYQGATMASPDVVNQKILDVVAWETKTFGYYQQTTATQTAQMLRQHFGYKHVDVVYDITLDDIKAQLTAGRPVIVPMAGRLLGNKYYKNPAPIYHMLVVKGIAKNGDIITNDVGTRRGYNYTYNPSVFLNAIHDAPRGGTSWNDNDDITKGQKAMIVVYPN